MNWGKSIVLAFLVFAGIIISMVVISMRQDVNLVEKNYYEEEIAYQDQIERIENFNNLPSKPNIEVNNRQLKVTFSQEVASEIKVGQIQLYRPSTSNLDKKYSISLNSSNEQLISLAEFKKGLWKVKLAWSSGTKEYFTSQSIVL